MSQKRTKKVFMDLSPVQIIWLHSQHLFQKIEEAEEMRNNEIKFYKNNNGVQIRFQHYNQNNPYELLGKAKQQLQKIIEQNQIRLMNTTLHKDIYIRISKQARKQFPKSYIIFLHYETFENCARKLQQKFAITSIMPQFEQLKSANPNFCFLVADNTKINEIEKYTNRILNSQISCAATTFSQNQKRQTVHLNRRSLSVSSLKGSLSDRQQNCRLSVLTITTEEEMFEVSEVTLTNISNQELDRIRKRRIYAGTYICIDKFKGSYLAMKKKLYYANRLQLSSNPYIQPIYAYSMIESNVGEWSIQLITDRKYSPLSQIMGKQWFISVQLKIQYIIKISRALLSLHRNNQSYGDLTIENILIDRERNLILSSIINKNIPPYTNPYLYDIRQLLIIIYNMFTQIDITYQMILKKQSKLNYFCSLSHRCKNPVVRKFLALTDDLFIDKITLEEFVIFSDRILKNS